MRISWLAPDVIAAAREALCGRSEVWEDHFSPEFEAPPRPADVIVPDWVRVTEHVARAERVTGVLREQGLQEALRRFAGSPFAIEVATLAAAAHSVDALSLEMIELVLACEIDDLLFYAPFLRLLVEMGGDDHARVLGAYETFSAAYEAKQSRESQWRERIGAVRDGLASAYVFAGRLDDGDALFARRHDEDRGDVAVALSASRCFLAFGALARAIAWLDIAADRATSLGRPELATTLREKQTSLRKRLS